MKGKNKLEKKDRLQFENFEKLNGLTEGDRYFFVYEGIRDDEEGIEIMASVDSAMMMGILNHILDKYPEESAACLVMRVQSDMEKMAMQFCTSANEKPI